MRLVAASICVLGLVVGGVVAASCSVTHKSDGFTECDNQSDCPAGERCGDNGLCEGSSSGNDAGPGKDGKQPDSSSVCPDQCTSCRLDIHECRVDCGVSPATCNNPIVCPEGFTCDIICSVGNSCRNGVDCTKGEACNITCSGQSACRNIDCGKGPCLTNCSGLQACRDIACGESCACDVNCGDQALCEQVSCTSIQCEKNFGNGCTSAAPGCFTCQP